MSGKCSLNIPVSWTVILILFARFVLLVGDSAGEEVLRERVSGIHEYARHPAGRCIGEPVSLADGAVVILDAVINQQTQKLMLIGPHKKLWIVAETPVLQANAVAWSRNFGEGRSLHWLPRVQNAASTCTFSIFEDPAPNDSATQQEGGKEQAADTRSGSSFLSFHADPTEHVNVASCPVPAWVLQAVKTDKDVRVQFSFMPKPLFQAVACTDKNDTSACEACQTLALEQDSIVRMEAAECIAAEKMRRRMVSSPFLPLCIPTKRDPVLLSLCCIMRNEGRYLREWIEYSRSELRNLSLLYRFHGGYLREAS
eukprot:2707591-Rhodomonas_salina.2